MSPLLLRAFVNERLTAAAEEIFQVFERTIAKYEEEASSSKQEIERLRGLLLEFVRTDVAQSPVCKDKAVRESCEQQDCDQEPINFHQGGPELLHIKEEDHELWSTEQQDKREAEVEAALFPPHSFVWEGNKQEDTKPLLQPQKQNCESEDEFKETQRDGKRTEQFPSPLASSLSSHNEGVQNGGDHERSAASFTPDQTQMEQDQTPFFTSRESAELSKLNSGALDHRCYLCFKYFASNHRLIIHAFRFHSKDAGVTCAVCGRIFESTESFDVHLNSHRSSKCCHMCGKHCNSTTALTEHMAGHAGVKLHRCHVCGKECSRKGDLKIHMRIHTGEKPFCCSFCCKRFTHSGHLRKHMRSHTGERPHRCEVCGRGFQQSAHLKYHLRTHTQKY
ncbi:uncharacterized protein [Leuresthes tenuis]|uniref:uncharacterized protein n=1 Tax=Leuresthes tenuis TaxID=355514 RepID=UPI003B504627